MAKGGGCRRLAWVGSLSGLGREHASACGGLPVRMTKSQKKIPKSLQCRDKRGLEILWVDGNLRSYVAPPIHRTPV